MQWSIFQIEAASIVGIVFLIIILVVILASAIKIIREYERAVVFRLGRLLGAKGPGVILIIPIIDRTRIVDLRVITLDIPKQRVITKDNVTADVDAVLYFRVRDPLNAIVKVQDYVVASSMIAQTTLRDVLGQVEFDDLLTKRDELNKRIQGIIDEVTDPWGIKVTAVAIRDITIPESMQRAIAKQAEAERERRGRIIMADGELQAAKKMQEAAEYYVKNPSALRLRELQTWAEIAREKNLIVVTEGSTQSLGSMLGLMKSLREKEKVEP
ncbi:MAG: slipin family protein [Nitrososphaerales archaeon]